MYRNQRKEALAKALCSVGMKRSDANPAINLSIRNSVPQLTEKTTHLSNLIMVKFYFNQEISTILQAKGPRVLEEHNYIKAHG